MYRAKVLRAPVEGVDQVKMEQIVSYLGERAYVPIIRQMISGALDVLGLTEVSDEILSRMFGQALAYRFRFPRSGGTVGDLFFRENEMFILDQPEPNLIQVATISLDGEPAGLTRFCNLIEEAIKANTSMKQHNELNLKWDSPTKGRLASRGGVYPFADEPFDSEPGPDVDQLRSRSPEYSSGDVSAAYVLTDSSTRQFLLKLAQVSKMMGRDVNNFIKSPDMLRNLLLLGLIAEEYLLTCRQDQHTICIISSKDPILGGELSSPRCSVCERPLAEENIQNVYTLTDRGKWLLDGSLWMSIWITQLLVDTGIEKSRIKWGVEVGGDEIDIMVSDFDSLLFFELKDREFGLGDAYPFVSRVSRYGGSLGIVVTMDRVSEDAKKFFKEEDQRRATTIAIRYFEGKASVEQGIPEIVNEIASLQVRRLLTPLSGKIGLDLWPLVEMWVNRKQK